MILRTASTHNVQQQAAQGQVGNVSWYHRSQLAQLSLAPQLRAAACTRMRDAQMRMQRAAEKGGDVWTVRAVLASGPSPPRRIWHARQEGGMTVEKVDSGGFEAVLQSRAYRGDVTGLLTLHSLHICMGLLN